MDDDDEPTIVDDSFESTPTATPVCPDCGAIVFLDAFTLPGSIVATGIFSEDRCVRAADGHWHWCASRRKLTYFVPR